MTKRNDDRPRPKTSAGNGGSPVTKDQENGKDVVFTRMDDYDIEQIVRAQEGLDAEAMVYNLPFRSKNGVLDCGYSWCDYRGKHPHEHAVRIGIAGVDEIIRQMGGIEVGPVGDVKMKVIDGRKFLEATAYAYDKFTGVKRTATVYYDFVKRGNTSRPQDWPVIAKRLAERNAATTLLPMITKQKIAELGRQAKRVLSAEDIAAILRPIYQEREPKKIFWLRAQVEAQRVLSGSQQALDDIPALPIPADAAPLDNPENTCNNNGDSDTEIRGGGAGMTQSQRRYLYKLLSEFGADKEDVSEFLKEAVTSKQDASAAIENFLQKDFSSFENWLALKKNEEGDESDENAQEDIPF